jgi:hypothetical protein
LKINNWPKDKVRNFKERTSKFRVKNHEIQNINKEPLDWLNSIQLKVAVFKIEYLTFCGRLLITIVDKNEFSSTFLDQ